METTGQWTRVILLTPPPQGGGGLTDSLRSQFESRDWFAIPQHDPYLAFTELCLRDKAQATRSSWGLQRMEQLALVITDLPHWGDLNAMTEAVRKYVPLATIWTADTDGIGPLDAPADDGAHAVGDPRLEATEPDLPSDSVFSTPEFSSAPAIAGPVANGSSNQSGKGDPIAASQRITREEIDMLLQMDPGVDQERRA